MSALKLSENEISDLRFLIKYTYERFSEPIRKLLEAYEEAESEALSTMQQAIER